MLRMRRFAIGVATALLLAHPVLSPVGATAPQYTIEDLGTIDGLVPSVTGINAAGQVSGFVFTSTGSRAVRLVDSGGWSYVPGLESLPSDAQDINVYGDLTGYVVTSAGDLRAYRYTATTGVLDFIQPMGTGSYTVGTAINASGEVTGYGDTGDPEEGTRSFRAAPEFPAQQLPSLNGMLVIGFGINDGGQVAGAATLPDGSQHTILVDADGTVHDIGGLNGSSTSMGNAVDNAGRVVGQAWVDAEGVTQHAFSYSNGSLTDLDSFGSSLSNAAGIADGTTVGYLHAGRRRVDACVRPHRCGWHGRSEHAYSERLRLDPDEGAGDQHFGADRRRRPPEWPAARVPADAAGAASATAATAATAAAPSTARGHDGTQHRLARGDAGQHLAGERTVGHRGSVGEGHGRFRRGTDLRADDDHGRRRDQRPMRRSRRPWRARCARCGTAIRTSVSTPSGSRAPTRRATKRTVR